MRYPIGMDLYQNRPVRENECEKGESKSLLSSITSPLPDVQAQSTGPTSCILLRAESINIVHFFKLSLLSLQPFKIKL